MNRINMSIKAFWKYKALLRELVIRDIKIRYRKSFLGLLWTVLNPLMMMIVMTFVFSTLFQSNIENFSVYFLTGNLLFSLNSEATTQAQLSILTNGALIKKVYIPKYLFPLSKILSAMINFCFAFVALIIVMIITNARINMTLVFFFVPVFYLILFSLGLGLFLSAVTVYFRDLTHLYNVIMLAWMYLTPIFYPLEIMPEESRGFIIWNPLYKFIVFFRQIVIEGKFPGLQQNIECLVIGLISLIIGVYVFYKKQDRFILYI